MYRFLHTTLRSAQVRINDEDSNHQRPPLADEAQGNSGISLLVVNIRPSIKIINLKS